MMLDLEVFDFDDPERWRKVQAVVNKPLAARALAAGMNARCRMQGKKWTPDVGPWQLSDQNSVNWPALQTLSPGPDSPNWYRIAGYCQAIAPWCAAIGKLIYPHYRWLVWYNRHVPEFQCHSAGMGLREGRRKSIVIMDVLWGQQTLIQGSEWVLMKLLAAPEAFALTVEDAIEHLERR